MNKRQKLSLAIILIGLLLIAAIIYFFFLKGPLVPGAIVADPDLPPAGQLPSVEESRVTPSDKPRNRIVYDISKEAEHQINATDVAKIAEVFAERLGSYSNQSNYANYEDLNILMTATMRDWALSYVNKMRADNPYDGSYYGITTKSVKTEVKKFDNSEGVAEIIVSTQRRETGTTISEKTYIQDLRLTFVKENNQWLVDGAYWLK